METKKYKIFISNTLEWKAERTSEDLVESLKNANLNFEYYSITRKYRGHDFSEGSDLYELMKKQIGFANVILILDDIGESRMEVGSEVIRRTLEIQKKFYPNKKIIAVAYGSDDKKKLDARVASVANKIVWLRNIDEFINIDENIDEIIKAIKDLSLEE